MQAPDAHLHRADPVMARLIDDYGGPLPLEPDFRGRPPDAYGALVRGITGQQLSVKAAASIWARFLERYDGATPTPEQILADDPEELRVAAGLLAREGALPALARRADRSSGELDLDRLRELPDDEVDPRAHRRQGDRRVDGAHVPDVHPAPAGCARHG